MKSKNSKVKEKKNEIKPKKKQTFSVDKIIKQLLSVRGKKPGKNIDLT
jgi:hypothetical protein